MGDYAAKERALDALRYGGSMNNAGLAQASIRPREMSDLEIAQAQAEQARYLRQQNRRDMLVAVCALGRRYDCVADAITDARELAAYIGVDLD
jgi:hypothetical protein